MFKQPMAGLVLTGGGARGAYQAGVLKAVSEITSSLKIKQPLPVLTGTSAGAVNVVALASGAKDFHATVKRLVKLWSTITFEQIYETGAMPLTKTGLQLISDLAAGGFYKKRMTHFLLNTKPLREFLNQNVPFNQIQKNIAGLHLHSVAVTAVNYNSASTITFYQGQATIEPWKRIRRCGEPTEICADHVMASGAIPLLFPPILIDGHYYGDGSLRHYTPLSPPIKLGAQKLLIVGVRQEVPRIVGKEEEPTSFGRILNVIMNAILLDAVELDYERLSRINRTLQHVAGDRKGEVPLRPIQACMIRPSEDIGEIAYAHVSRMPYTVRHLLKGLGSEHDAVDLISYLLFHSDFTKRLIDLGYNDAMKQKDTLKEFFEEN